jgi:hypothetical protein
MLVDSIAWFISIIGILLLILRAGVLMHLDKIRGKRVLLRFLLGYYGLMAFLPCLYDSVDPRERELKRTANNLLVAVFLVIPVLIGVYALTGNL